MSVKIRLQRFGKKGKPYFHIVAADSRFKRDGRFIERLGNYNPNTNPATIELDNEKALTWLQNGAVPTDTARAILSYKGVLHKFHLLRGVEKGAFSAEEAERKYNAWLEQKEGKIQSKRDNLSSAADKDRAARLKAEKEVNEARAKAIAEANIPVVEEAPAEEAAEEAAEAAADASAEAADSAPEASSESTEA
jgi:small subunit ribosomal protein S16